VEDTLEDTLEAMLEATLEATHPEESLTILATVFV
jgi:hypothetical protein